MPCSVCEKSRLAGSTLTVWRECVTLSKVNAFWYRSDSFAFELLSTGEVCGVCSQVGYVMEIYEGARLS